MLVPDHLLVKECLRDLLLDLAGDLVSVEGFVRRRRGYRGAILIRRGIDGG